MAFLHFKIGRIMRRSDFDRAGAEFHIHGLVADYGNLAVLDGQDNPPTYKFFISFILGIYCHGRVSQHSLGPHGGHGYMLHTVLRLY